MSTVNEEFLVKPEDIEIGKEILEGLLIWYSENKIHSVDIISNLGENDWKRFIYMYKFSVNSCQCLKYQLI